MRLFTGINVMNTLMSSAAFAALCALAPISQAATIEINFDTVAAGSQANVAAPAGIRFLSSPFCK